VVRSALAGPAAEPGQSRAYAAAGDIQAALAEAQRAGTSPEATVTLAHAWAVAGDDEAARRILAPALAADSQVPDWVRLHAWLVDARLSYHDDDDGRGRRSLASALRLAEREQIRLPFALEGSWLGAVLRRDPNWPAATGCCWPARWALTSSRRSWTRSRRRCC
jgi:hypothetical protein